jgi:hypothetical protein
MQEFSKELFGYDSIYVNNEIRKIILKNTNLIDELNKDLQSLQKETELLRQKIETLKEKTFYNEKEVYETDKEIIAQELLNSYMQSNDKLLSIINSLSEQEEQKLRQLNSYKDKYNKIKLSLFQLKKEFLEKSSQYNKEQEG